MGPSKCIPEADLRAFQLGEMPERLAEVVARHLEECPTCEALACRLDGVSDPILGLVRQPPSNGDLSQPTGAWAFRTPTHESASLTAPPAANIMETAPRVPGYALLAELGRGGMSVVFLARQESPERLVALKMIQGGPYANAERRARFCAEANAIARLHHPNIVTIYEVGEHAGVPYLSLEHVAGGTLNQHTRGAPQPARDAAAHVETLARAMHAAHQQGVIHRDLKPANILLQARADKRNPAAVPSPRLEDFDPKITDFGLAKQTQSDLTATGAVLGTPSYMAPEQAAGDNAKVTAAADVFALGAILYELLTGRLPFQGASVLETLEQVRTREPVAPRLLQPGVPRDLETICLKCLEKEPWQRYSSAAALADDLRNWLESRPIAARLPGRVRRLALWVRRRPAQAALFGVSAVAVLTSVALGWAWCTTPGLIRPTPPSRQPSPARTPSRSRPTSCVSAPNGVSGWHAGSATRPTCGWPPACATRAGSRACCNCWTATGPATLRTKTCVGSSGITSGTCPTRPTELPWSPFPRTLLAALS
jgi:hypothetical protein